MIEIRAKSPNSVGIFATEDIEEGTVIIRECPLFADMLQKMLHFHTSSTPTGVTAIDEEIQSLQHIIRISGQRHQVAMLRSKREGNEHFNEMFPVRARAALDKLSVYAYQHEFNQLPESVQKKWLSLHDAFQDVPIGMESPVGIFGLKSPKGEKLNGTIGTSLGKRGTGKDKGRYSVRTAKKNETEGNVTEDLWIKRENLKTVYGTCRSNTFQSGLFEKICRINHSCLSNTTMMSVEKLNRVLMMSVEKLNRGLESQLPPDVGLTPAQPNEQAIVPVNIGIKVGEELTLNYLGKCIATRSTKTRRETLREKYGFTCECEACKRNEFC